MPNTIVAPVNTSQLVGGAQTAVALTPVASDPAVSATTAQVYAKTDKNLYHEDVAGNITNLLVPAQLANSSFGPQTAAVGPFFAQNTTTGQPGYGNYGVSFVSPYAGSMIAASLYLGSGQASTPTFTILKNGNTFATPFSSVSAINGLKYYFVTYGNGVYPVSAGDQISVSTATGGNTASLCLFFNFGTTSVSSVSSVLSANTTVASTDNQRTWVASSSTAYTLTLPATNASQDFYVRVLVSGGAGVTVQAPSGVTIYLGATVSQSAGNINSSAAGSTIVLVNPAGSSVWLANSITGNWSVT